MTSDNNAPYPRDGPFYPDTGHPTQTADAIAAVGSVALQLYRRAKTSGPEFDDVAAEARSLYTELRHLRIEAEDPNSVLIKDKAVFAQPLAQLVENSEFTLQEVEALLEKYGNNTGSAADHGGEQGDRRRSALPDSDSKKRPMIARVLDKLARCKGDIDDFLTNVQLHTPTQTRHALNQTNAEQLDAIKDKVDAIAMRIHNRRRAADYPGDEEEIWVQFRTELEHEGFSKEVLRKNQVRGCAPISA
jgi:hypothetical protein